MSRTRKVQARTALSCSSFFFGKSARRAAPAIFILIAGVAVPALSGTEEGLAALKNKDYKTAIANFQEASAEGDLDATNYLGEIYTFGMGVEEDSREGCRYFEIAAKGGLAMGQHNFATCFESDIYGKPDFSQAASWYQRAADQEFFQSMCALGNLHRFGQGVPKNMKKAHELCLKGAEAGVMLSQADLGVLLLDDSYEGHDFKEAAKWLERAAEQGHINAAYNLGLMYYQGDGVEKNLIKAQGWLEKVAFKKDKRAYFPLATIFFNVCVDLEKQEIYEDLVGPTLFWLTIASEAAPDATNRESMRVLLDSLTALAPHGPKEIEAQLDKWRPHLTGP